MRTAFSNCNTPMINGRKENLGRILKQRRVMLSLTLKELAALSGVSPSHLGRIEKGNRFPSATVLKKLTEPLSFTESELFSLADYLSFPSDNANINKPGNLVGQINPQISMLLSNEPVEVQHAIFGILNILKSLALLTNSKQK
ncbi:MAG: helix-turn-helix transcriptional regulator [Dehalococcoidales bacterium]|nr:MAG: helix-turn-helix transcriptional regulator [Dehalococcoidales bacterium]